MKAGAVAHDTRRESRGVAHINALMRAVVAAALTTHHAIEPVRRMTSAETSTPTVTGPTPRR